jgi:hypothetical protein
VQSTTPSTPSQNTPAPARQAPNPVAPSHALSLSLFMSSSFASCSLSARFWHRQLGQRLVDGLQPRRQRLQSLWVLPRHLLHLLDTTRNYKQFKNLRLRRLANDIGSKREGKRGFCWGFYFRTQMGAKVAFLSSSPSRAAMVEPTCGV